MLGIFPSKVMQIFVIGNSSSIFTPFHHTNRVESGSVCFVPWCIKYVLNNCFGFCSFVLFKQHSRICLTPNRDASFSRNGNMGWQQYPFYTVPIDLMLINVYEFFYTMLFSIYHVNILMISYLATTSYKCLNKITGMKAAI